MSFLHYLLEANIYLAVFYLLYCIVLQRDTHYKLTRAYLLVTCMLAYIIPLIQVGILKPVGRIYQITTIEMPYAVKSNAMPAEVQHFTLQDALFYSYLVGITVMGSLFLFKLYQLSKLKKNRYELFDNKYKLITVPDSSAAFSFFNCLFIGSKLSGAQTIIRHELVHVRQKHSFDIVFIEIMKIISWFNPFIYLLQTSLKTVHEYIADEYAAAYEKDALVYSSFLVSNAYGISGSSLTHSFFNNNLLRKRINMLNQKRSGNLARLKYLIVLPVCASLLCISTLGFSKNYGWLDIAPPLKTDTARYVHKTTNDKQMIQENAYTNAKGYKILERSTVKNGALSQKVIITGNDGITMTYYREKTSAAQRKMLLDKYGYQFPAVKITLTPPPPIDKTKIPPPPPPQPPHKTSDHKSAAVTLTAPPVQVNMRPPPPPPAQIIINDPDSSKAIPKGKPVRSLVYLQPKTGNVYEPLIIVNGARYNLKSKLKPGEYIYITASDSVVVYTSGDVNAKKKYGDNARNGVIELHGKPSFTVR